MGQSLFDDFLWDNFRGLSKSEAAYLFMSCWKKLSSKIIINSWRFESNDSSDDENESSSESWEIKEGENGTDQEPILLSSEGSMGVF